jgi:hypothetical protein
LRWDAGMAPGIPTYHFWGRSKFRPWHNISTPRNISQTHYSYPNKTSPLN